MASAVPLPGRLIALRSGVAIPALGLGTWQVRGSDCVIAVTAALRAGYRHIDTAAVYRNEADVAAGIAASGVPRSEIFITTKLAPADHGAKAYAACVASLARLRSDYVDLYLVHWPGVGGSRADDPSASSVRRATWAAMQQLHRDGKARAIGVSNYMACHLEDCFGGELAGGEPPVLNQLELHPLLQQAAAVRAARERGLAIEAYSSLARGDARLLEAEPVRRIAAKFSCSAAQLALAWALRKGWIIIPKSTKIERIVENAGALALVERLTDAQTAELDALEAAAGSLRTCWDPSGVA